jgi:hypothetical protein
MKVLILLLATLLSSHAISGHFIPENQISIAPSHFKTLGGGVSEEKFNSIAEKIENIYAPFVTVLGGKLIINKRWEFKSVNAFAYKHEDKWTVELSGGLARHPLMTEDAFALVVCHELGHLIGGAPKDKNPVKKVYSNEGQADYFAVTKCLRIYFSDENNAKAISNIAIPPLLKNSCSKVYKNKKKQDICVRIGLAGLDNGKFFATTLKKAEPKLETPDQNIVTVTFDNHPDPQCRLDTYFQGILCDKSPDENFRDDDETTGACHDLHKDKTGLRPRCWFRPEKL